MQFINIPHAAAGQVAATTSVSARYQITHRTHYQYSEPVAICQNQLRMQPCQRGDVEVHSSTLDILPPTDSEFDHIDYFGNYVRSFTIETLHRELEVIAKSEITVSPKDVDLLKNQPDYHSFSWQSIAKMLEQRGGELWNQREFCFASPRVRTDKVFADYAKQSFLPDRDVIEACLDLTQRINRDFKYDSTATHVDTTTEAAFQLKAGVCQDFAHVQIACLRSIGLPARYISGYLRTIPPEGAARMVGADESHAWLSVWTGERMGWIDCDPTNACFTGSHHIPICVGRDYGDVAPMRGVVLGGGQTTLNVSVDVRPLP